MVDKKTKRCCGLVIERLLCVSEAFVRIPSVILLFSYFLFIMLFHLERKPTDPSRGFVSISWASCCTGHASGWLRGWFCVVFKLTNFVLRGCFTFGYRGWLFLWTHAQRASMLYFATVFFHLFYARLSWPNGWTDLHETFTCGRY